MSDYNLFSDPESQHKLSLGIKLRYITSGIHLLPHNLSGVINTCPYANECAKYCLNSAGMGNFDSVQEARKRRTMLFANDRAKFLALTVLDIRKLVNYCKNRSKRAHRKFTPAVRLNLTSDITYYKFARFLFDMFPNVQFYDYTKNPHTVEDYIAGKLPQNYHITFSSNAKDYAVWEKYIAQGVNIAMVFETIPETFRGWEIIDGTKNDLRFKDDKGKIVALLPLGKAKRDTSGFVYRGEKAMAAMVV